MVETQMTAAATILRFMFAGNAVFTLRSKESEVRFTYKVQLLPKRTENEAPAFAVRLLTGPDNTNDYQFMAMIVDGRFFVPKSSKVGKDSKSVVAFEWSYNKFQKGILPEKLEFWHTGRCGRCGRLLTVPESIESGLGPECALKG